MVREGLETALILFFAAVQGATTAVPLVGVLARSGDVGRCIGSLIYQGAVKVNLAVFFKWTGALLILVAAGIFKYGVHDLQEAGILPGLQHLAFDISHVIPPDSWYARAARRHVQLHPGPDACSRRSPGSRYARPGAGALFLPGRPSTPPAVPAKTAHDAA